jgi:hypothetical protein
MEIREKLPQPIKETTTVAFAQKELIWEGVGARVQISQGAHEDIINAFILDRTDSPLSSSDATAPRVLRVIGSGGNSDIVDDYILYSTDDTKDNNEDVALFRSPKVIKDIDDHLRGEWPIPHAFVSSSGVMALRNLIEVVLTENSSRQVEFASDDSKVFTHLGGVSLRAAGTAPIQPVRTN